MEHFEFLYVLHHAHTVRRFIADAEAEGEEFHASDLFHPLKCGLEAQAQIRKIQLSDPEPVLILRLRHKPGLADAREIAMREAHSFFSGEFTALPQPVEDRGRIEHVFYSRDVPKPVTLDYALNRSASDAGVPPGSDSRAPADRT